MKSDPERLWTRWTVFFSNPLFVLQIITSWSLCSETFHDRIKISLKWKTVQLFLYQSSSVIQRYLLPSPGLKQQIIKFELLRFPLNDECPNWLFSWNSQKIRKKRRMSGKVCESKNFEVYSIPSRVLVNSICQNWKTCFWPNWESLLNNVGLTKSSSQVAKTDTFRLGSTGLCDQPVLTNGEPPLSFDVGQN